MAAPRRRHGGGWRPPPLRAPTPSPPVTPAPARQRPGNHRPMPRQPAGAMVVVDLPGPEAVAFAAGAASAFDPVFALDNWPHPRGVVPAHQTLAAAAYCQPLFARRASGSAAPRWPLLVLDRR